MFNSIDDIMQVMGGIDHNRTRPQIRAAVQAKWRRYENVPADFPDAFREDWLLGDEDDGEPFGDEDADSRYIPPYTD